MLKIHTKTRWISLDEHDRKQLEAESNAQTISRWHQGQDGCKHWQLPSEQMAYAKNELHTLSALEQAECRIVLSMLDIIGKDPLMLPEFIQYTCSFELCFVSLSYML
ncbi:hypothetical protein ACN38_g10709 [Penicillium nordicum]|uniref:Uncharacterized protein n=1 Tax=Penicillium nordicum TaxID=229535 RepID=A0A0N0RXS7_9EURO|nr:hypothetical protein ACN38_g10709 [Penicillium nordicum]